MPAKNLNRKDEKGIYSHIYNKGVEKRIIFNEKQDYEVFQDFLKDYLNAPQDPESIKKDFTVHGRIFRGTPHQPKNYFNKVELIAYSLMPDHFHLLLHQKTRGSLEKFIRSLCTRYSMYFNKKYQHTGALFEGPYKSVHIQDESRLLHLTRYLHHAGSYSSYAEYLGTRETSWVKPQVVLSSFDKGTSYKDFVENELDQKEKDLTSGITIESETQHLERRDPERNIENYPPEPAESSEKILVDQNLKPLQRIPELLTSTLVFLLLLTLGIRNIMPSVTKSYQPLPIPIQSAPTPAVLAETEEATPGATLEAKPELAAEATSAATPAAKPETILTVKINDEVTHVNIRQKPTTSSRKVGQAKDGDTFEFVSISSGWYEVKLADGSTGFILATYIEKGETNN